MDNVKNITPKYLRNIGPINPKTLPQSNQLNHTNVPRTDLLSNFYYKIPANQSNDMDFQSKKQQISPYKDGLSFNLSPI